MVVSRKVGKAVVRNRVRRRLKEAARELLKGDLAPRAKLAGVPSLDMMIIARPVAAEATYLELKGSLGTALRRASLLA